MLELATSLQSEIIEARRRIHRFPELGYRESKTAAFIAERLRSWGLEPREGVARTGLTADISKGDGPTVLIRADIDALPIKEDSGLAFASEHPGVMHACGHDAHAAMALGAAHMLVGTDFEGTVRVLFQPAEEGNYDDPEGHSGAARAILDGVLDGVCAAIGLHQMPQLPSGTLSLRDGPVMAAADFFELRVRGRSSHAGMAPEKGVDAVLAAAELVTSLQRIVARRVPPSETAVLSVSSIHGGSAPNVLADEVVLTGTIRALDERIHALIHEEVRATCRGLSAVHGAEMSFEVTHGVPVTFNDPRVAEVCRRAAYDALGPESLQTIDPIMAGEDFSYFGRHVPSCFGLLGTKLGEGEQCQLHNPRMILDEAALPKGAAFLAEAALQLLRSER